MDWSLEIQRFIAQHKDDDTDRLLLSASRFTGIDVPAAVDQILARRQIRNKLPEWYANDNLILGGRIPAEQCSSELTARYKRSLVVGDTLCDMTGGMGVDMFYMSRGLARAIYTERQTSLCEVARRNFSCLGADNIEIREGDGITLPIPDVDTIYLDPARRASDGSRVYDLADCEPNVVEWQEELLRHCSCLIVKMSPMADLSRVLRLMPTVSKLHILAVKGECKEVIAICENKDMNKKTAENVKVCCVDFRSFDTIKYEYSINEEVLSQPVYVSSLGKYLYEPDVTLLKAGAFKSLCSAFNVEKLDVNTHLYTSAELQKSFPGRIFEIEEMIDFSSKTLKKLKTIMPKANITARNFVMTADQLRSRTGIKDGGETYLFAVSVKNIGNVLLRCRRALCALILCLCSCLSVFAQKNKTETVEQLLSGIKVQAPINWKRGMEFVFLNDNINMILTPEQRSTSADTTNYRGTIWAFDAIVSEEDWMGQQTMALRFISPKGEAYRFSTERLMTQVEDTTFVPKISGLFPKHIIDEVNAVLRARTLYININDERISDGDSLRFEKFVPVVIDSVSFGTELAPIRIFYVYEDGKKTFLLTSLPGSRETATSTVITRFLSTTDPYLDHPDITLENWRHIQRSEVVMDMTREECRLSWGKYQRYETHMSKAGAAERWYYSGGRILDFIDGRLVRVGREK